MPHRNDYHLATFVGFLWQSGDIYCRMFILQIWMIQIIKTYPGVPMSMRKVMEIISTFVGYNILHIQIVWPLQRESWKWSPLLDCSVQHIKMQDNNQSVLTSLSWWCWCQQQWWQWQWWQATHDHNNNKWPQQSMKKMMAMDSNNNTQTTKLWQ